MKAKAATPKIKGKMRLRAFVFGGSTVPGKVILRKCGLFKQKNWRVHFSMCFCRNLHDRPLSISISTSSFSQCCCSEQSRHYGPLFLMVCLSISDNNSVRKLTVYFLPRQLLHFRGSTRSRSKNHCRACMINKKKRQLRAHKPVVLQAKSETTVDTFCTFVNRRCHPKHSSPDRNLSIQVHSRDLRANAAADGDGVNSDCDRDDMSHTTGVDPRLMWRSRGGSSCCHWTDENRGQH